LTDLVPGLDGKRICLDFGVLEKIQNVFKPKSKLAGICLSYETQ